MLATWCGSRWYIHGGESGEYLFRCTRQALEECGRPGRMDEPVAYWATRVTWNHDTVEPLRDELRGYGAWSDTLDTDDLDTCRQRILWIAASDWREEQNQRGASRNTLNSGRL